MKKKPESSGAAPDVTEVRTRALALLARREHSARELKRKLFQRGYPPELIETVVAGLTNDNSLSESRYAEGWVRSRVARGQGPRKIEAGLRQQALDDTEINRALSECGADWGVLAADVRRKRFGPILPTGVTERARQSRFLESRGFAPEQIRRALSNTAET